MFFRTPKGTPEHDSELAKVIATAIPEADEDTVAIVTAISGLLGCVAYADRQFSAKEQAAVRAALETINGLGTEAADAIIEALARNIIRVATVESPRYSRTLVQRAARELRVKVLDMLLEVAAADKAITHDEVVVLRTLTKSMGLEQADYNRLQKEHLALLSSLHLSDQ